MMHRPRIARPIIGRHQARRAVVTTLAVLALAAVVTQCLAAEALVLRQDDAKVMKFSKMKRVWVTDPAIIDVVVSGYNELLVYSKGSGNTKLYVWDSRGRHEYAVEVTRVPVAGSVARELANVLGPRLRYIVVDDKTILIEGEVTTAAEKERVTKVAEAKGDGLKVVDAVTVRGMGLSPAGRYQQAFEQLFPDELTYTAIDDSSLVIEGTVATAAECARMDQIIKAASNLKVVNLVRCAEGNWDPQSSRIDSLRKSLGEQYEYVVIDSNTIAVKGIAPSALEKERVDRIVTAIAGDTKIVNMVQLAESTKTPVEQLMATLKPMFAQPLIYRTMDANTLVIEGQMPTAAEKERLDKVLDGAPASVKVINLVTVPSGRDAWANSSAGRTADKVGSVIGEDYSIVAIDETTILIEGIATSQEELTRVSDAVGKLAGTLTVINMVTTTQEASGATAADRIALGMARVLPPGVTAVAIDEKTVLLEGIVPSTLEKDRADKIAELASKSADANILSLVMTQTQSKSPAVRRVDQLRKVLGDKYNYITWDDDTVLIEGRADTQGEVERVKRILDSVAQDWKVGNLVTFGAAPIDVTDPESDTVLKEIGAALGANFHVRRVNNDKLVVEGLAEDAQDLERTNKILELYSDQAQVVNLVTVAKLSPALLTSTSEALQDALGSVYQVRTLQGKAIVVEGVAMTKNEQERTRLVIDTLAKDVPVVDLVTLADPGKRQIVVHVKIMSITRGTAEQLGVNWGQLVAGDGGVAFGGQPILLGIEGGFGTLSTIVANVIAQATDDRGQILAEPNLVVNDGETAEMVVGGEIPIPVPQMGAGGSSITIEYKQYGVVLNIKPSILEDGKTVRLDLQPEVSSVDFSTQVSIGGFGVPGFRTRRTKTVVDVQDGAALLMGGLIQHEQTKVITEIPFISKLPIIGELFRSKDFKDNTTELVVLVSPEIIKNKQP